MHAPSDFISTRPDSTDYYNMTTHAAQVTVSSNVTTVLSGNDIHDYTYTEIWKLHLTLTEHSF